MLVLDTSSVLEVLKGSVKGRRISDMVKDDAFFITSLTAYEILFGMKEGEENKMSEFIEGVEILVFDSESSKKSGAIARHLKKSGNMINVVDILIAGICVEKGAEIITFDRDFGKIHGLKARIVEEN